MGEAQAAVGVRQVVPSQAGQGHQRLAEHGGRGGVVQAGRLGDVPGFDLGGVGVAELGDRLHDQAGDLPGDEQADMGDRQGSGDAEFLGGLAGWHAWAVEAVGEAAADRPEGQ